MTTARKITLTTPDGNVQRLISNHEPFALLAGPCSIESREHSLEIAGRLKEITASLGIPFVFKSSFDKANRTSIHSYRGVGMDAGLEILQAVREAYNVPVVTDVHLPEQCGPVAQVADILQIPAFLCRQTDLLVAAAKTGKIINVKKGQFLSPSEMRHVATKIDECGNPNVMLCERGATFGYNTLVNDMRALPIMASSGHPVIFDATHSVMMPGGSGDKSGGDRRFVEPLARAALAIGIAGLFLETHEAPDRAPSDGPNMVPLSQLRGLLERLLLIDQVAKDIPFTLAS